MHFCRRIYDLLMLSDLNISDFWIILKRMFDHQMLFDYHTLLYYRRLVSSKTFRLLDGDVNDADVAGVVHDV